MTESYHVRVIHIKAEDSPNVRLALAQQRAGLPVTGEILLAGVLSWADYQQRRATWDKIQQCVGLDGLFYEGAENLLFPPSWLGRAKNLARFRRGRPRRAKGVGVDPGEGKANTTMVAVDEYGVVDLYAKKTPDTSVTEGDIAWFLTKHGVPAERCCIDRGAGKTTADNLRARGLNVRTVGFGEAISPPPRRGKNPLANRLEVQEQRGAYVNRRAQMYGDLRDLMNPAREYDQKAVEDDNDDWGGEGGSRHTPKTRLGKGGFAIPEEYEDLFSQMSPIPLLRDRSGRLRLPPKDRHSENSNERTLVEIIGHSPDELDALVLAVHAMLYEASHTEAGVF